MKANSANNHFLRDACVIATLMIGLFFISRLQRNMINDEIKMANKHSILVKK